MLSVAAREQPVGRPRQTPGGAQDARQLRRQHDVAVLATFALLDADHHPAAVDVGDHEADHRADVQSASICGGQRRPVLQAGHRLQKAHYLIGAEDHRQLPQLARVRDPFRQFGLTQRDPVAEAERADDLLERRPGDTAGEQMHLEGANVLEVKLVGRAAEEPAELRHRV